MRCTASFIFSNQVSLKLTLHGEKNEKTQNDTSFNTSFNNYLVCFRGWRTISW